MDQQGQHCPFDMMSICNKSRTISSSSMFITIPLLVNLAIVVRTFPLECSLEQQQPQKIQILWTMVISGTAST
jgi:hypothetical protein